jgi:hypothetical protein
LTLYDAYGTIRRSTVRTGVRRHRYRQEALLVFTRHGFRVILLMMAFVLGVVYPAAADYTVIFKYTLVGGDTLTRANYYTNRRMRVTAPDGREFVFDRKGDSVMVINHKARTYWAGKRAVADTIASRIIKGNRVGVEQMTADPEKWNAMVSAFNDSIRVVRTYEQKKVAGVTCDQYVLTAGSYLTNVRWVARSIDVANYGPELEKVVMAAIKDPLNRQLMRLVIAARPSDGLALAGRATFRTHGGFGNYSFDAVSVKSGEVPSKVWKIPEGYTPIQP